MDGTNIKADVADSVTGAELRQFIGQVERVRAEMSDMKEREKEIFAEAKSRGYMTRPIRTIIKERAKNPDDLAAEAAVVEMYKAALGMA